VTVDIVRRIEGYDTFNVAGCAQCSCRYTIMLCMTNNAVLCRLIEMQLLNIGHNQMTSARQKVMMKSLKYLTAFEDVKFSSWSYDKTDKARWFVRRSDVMSLG